MCSSDLNLMVFLRPTIVRHADDTRDITRDRYANIIDEKRQVNPGPSQVLETFSADVFVRDPAAESDYEKREPGTATGDTLLGPPNVQDSPPGAALIPDS